MTQMSSSPLRGAPLMSCGEGRDYTGRSGLGQGSRSGRLDAIAPRILGLVERAVGTFESALGAVTFAERGQAGRERDGNALALEVERTAADRRKQRLHQLQDRKSKRLNSSTLCEPSMPT